MKFESKVSFKGLKWILLAKSDSKDLKVKFQKVLVLTLFASQKQHSDVLLIKKFRKLLNILKFESKVTLFASQKQHSDVLLIKKFRKLLNILKFESKVSCKGLKGILLAKSDSKNLKVKFSKSTGSNSV